MTKFKIELDKKKCIGCGACTAVCPDYFDMDEDGKAKVKKQLISDIGCSKQAEDTCPVNAISVTEQ